MMMMMIMVITMMTMMMMIVRSRIALGLLQSKSVGRSGSWLRTGLTGQRDCDDDGDDDGDGDDDDDKCDMGNQYNDGRDKVWSWFGRTLVGQRNATQELGDRVR